MDSPQAVRVQVPVSALRWPPVCACCCGPADVQLPPAVFRGAGPAASKWAVPYCSDCLGHAARFARADQIRRKGYLACAVTLGTELVVVLLLWALAARFLEWWLTAGLAKGLTFLVGTATVFLTYFLMKETLDRARAETDRVLERADHLVRGACGSHHFAVSYAGGDGATVTFDIYNARFAADFRRLNGGQRLA